MENISNFIVRCTKPLEMIYKRLDPLSVFDALIAMQGDNKLLTCMRNDKNDREDQIGISNWNGNDYYQRKSRLS